jgi:predicted AAA+ superfamily ATPase
MPEVVFIDKVDIKRNFLKNLINSIMFKDIVARYKVRDTALLERVLAFVANTTGSLLSARNIAGTLTNELKENVVSKTIINYLTYFEVPYIINEVPRYDLNGKKILEYVSKYYFTDIGMRNSFGYDFTQDINKILENLVYIKLRQEGYTVYVGANKGLEIDFVAEKNGEKTYYQVTYLLATPEVIEREF